MAKWNAWIDGLGTAISDKGTPLGMSHMVDAKGSKQGADNPLSGYLVVEAASIDAALALAENCPVCDAGGTVEVAQMMQM